MYYWFGYKLHLVIDALYELPVSFTLTLANETDTMQMETLLQRAGAEQEATKPKAVIADKGYDSQSNYKFIFNEYKAMPIIPIREREDAQLPDICNAKGTPTCGCGLEMVYWGRDGNYLKYRCPHILGKAECKSRFRCTSSPYGYALKLSIADDPRRHPPVPRQTRKWQRLYRMRSAVERVNSRVKELLGLDKITVRGLGKVTVRAILSLLTMLAIGVGMAQKHRLKELRCLVAWTTLLKDKQLCLTLRDTMPFKGRKSPFPGHRSYHRQKQPLLTVHLRYKPFHWLSMLTVFLSTTKIPAFRGKLNKSVACQII